MGWRIFKSTDVGAPSANFGVAGTVINMLRACLIDGYGSGVDLKTPVGGWSEPFLSVGNIATFRADTGRRQFYRIDDSSTGGVAAISAYESMTDINTGDGMWCNLAFGKRDGASGELAWIVVANEYTVVVMFPGWYGWVPQIFGEYASAWEGNPYNSLVAANHNYSYLDIGITAFAPSNLYSARADKGVFIHRLPDGLGLGSRYGLVYPLQVQLSGTAPVPHLQTLANKKPFMAPMLIGGYVSAPGSIFDGVAGIHGSLPDWLLTADCRLIDGTAGHWPIDAWSDPITGENFLSLPTDNTTNNDANRYSFAINLTGIS